MPGDGSSHGSCRMISTLGMCDRSTLIKTRALEIELGKCEGGYDFRLLVYGGGERGEREASVLKSFCQLKCLFGEDRCCLCWEESRESGSVQHGILEEQLGAEALLPASLSHSPPPILLPLLAFSLQLCIKDYYMYLGTVYPNLT